MRLLATAASGVRAQQVLLDTVADNLANVNTTGFKARKVDFVETLAEYGNQKGTQPEDPSLLHQNIGFGAEVRSTLLDLRPGSLLPSDNPMDLAVSGVGFFPVITPDGRTAYARSGTFRLAQTSNEVGQKSMKMVDSLGNILKTKSPLNIPDGEYDMTVSAAGEITGKLKDQSNQGQSQVFGQILLARFDDAERLENIGNNLLAATTKSGPAIEGAPGSDGTGSVETGVTEQSNVDLASTMANLIEAQRAYQMNVRLIKDADQMWEIANSMRR